MEFHIREADYADPVHTTGIVDVLNSYAADLVGGAKPLSADVRERLVPALQSHPSALALLAFAAQQPVGIALCCRLLLPRSPAPGSEKKCPCSKCLLFWGFLVQNNMLGTEKCQAAKGLDAFQPPTD